MPPSEGETAPEFEALLCDGETFRPTTLTDELDADGGVLVFFGFTFSAIAENWWKRYQRARWQEFAVPVLGVCRDGPYAQNEFLRQNDLPFDLFADVDATAIDAYDLREERDGMGPTTTARRAVYVLDGDRTVQYRWLGEDWISPVPRDEIEATVAEL
ncbi:MAG: redoxin domain-containing protein [Haloarculaceae archaeon]